MYSDIKADQLTEGTDIAVIHESTFNTHSIDHGKVVKVLKTRVVVELDEGNGYKAGRQIRYILRDGHISGEEGRRGYSHYSTLVLPYSERYNGAKNRIIEDRFKNKIRGLADKITRTHDLVQLDKILTELTELHADLGIHLAKKGN